MVLYTGQQFLEVGRSNQDRLQKDRVGLMQDVFATLLEASDFNETLIQTQIDSLSALNPDITAFRIVTETNEGFVPIAALSADVIGVYEPDPELYRRASLSLDETVIFEFSATHGRLWQAFRTIRSQDGDVYFIFTEFDLSAIDSAFASKERDVLWSLLVVYVIFIAVAYWLIRQTDFRNLYLQSKQESETKDQFVNMIAHELRAPLTAIKGYSSLLEERLTDEESILYSVRTRESAERLIAIVNDLLDVARIQSGKLAVEQEVVNVSAVVTAVIDELRISAEQKQISLTQVGTDTVHEIQGDTKRLHQALTNLVSNAIKYTKEGTIELEVIDKPTEVELRVKDTGMGISAEDQQKLFAPFFRVKSDSVAHITGTGLGMWITKQLIELMGAKIGVESIKGVGTHVVVSLPKQTGK